LPLVDPPGHQHLPDDDGRKESLGVTPTSILKVREANKGLNQFTAEAIMPKGWLGSCGL
jgi:hypothetical protein